VGKNPSANSNNNPCNKVIANLEQETQVPAKKQNAEVNKQSSKLQIISNTNFLETFVLLLDWLNQSNLKSSIDFHLPFSNESQVFERCVRLLPQLTDLLMNFNDLSCLSTMKKYHLTILEFIYFSMLHIELSFSQKVKPVWIIFDDACLLKNAIF
jgi:hypothetical protein